MMNPEFSRRLARVVNSPYFLDHGMEFRNDFVNEVQNKKDFDDLSDKHKNIILEAEKTLKPYLVR